MCWLRVAGKMKTSPSIQTNLTLHNSITLHLNMECFLLYLSYNGFGDFFCGHAGEVMSGVDGFEFFKDIHILISGADEELLNI